MNIDTLLSPAELPALARRDLSGTACVVFDILRATSTFVTALYQGANEIIPVSEISEAVALRQRRPEVLLAGERGGVKISAALSGGVEFDFGNSPREFTPERVRGRTIVSTTTNGTRALRACAAAKTVLAGSFLNLAATAEFLRGQENVLLVCAGTGENMAAEDVLAAGALTELLSPRPMKPKMEERAPHPGPLPIGSADAEREKHSGRLDVGRHRLVQGFKAQNEVRRIPSPPLSPSDGERGSARTSEGRAQTSEPTEIARRRFTELKTHLGSALGDTQNGRRLLAIPELHDDVAYCARRDVFNLVAVMQADGLLRRI